MTLTTEGLACTLLQYLMAPKGQKKKELHLGKMDTFDFF
jgi:hypothetical protein